MNLLNPTSEFYNLFVHIYNYYNENLFDNELKMPIIVITRKKNVFGYFSFQRWRDSLSRPVDEIALNPQMFTKYPITEICQTIVHEMCHQWQYQYGTPTRSGYHNTEWSQKMQIIGLMPSSTGKPGGTMLGQKMADYPIDDGIFIKHTEKLLLTEIFQKLYYENVKDDNNEIEVVETLIIEESDPEEVVTSENSSDDFLELLERNGKKNAKENKPKCMDLNYLQTQNEKKLKVKYTCEICDTNVWGKPDLSIICGSCKTKYTIKTKQNETTLD